MLDINPVLLGIVFVTFLITMFLLNKWLFKPLLTYMDNRDSSIKNDLNNIRSNSDEVVSLRLEADRIILEAKKEESKIKEKAHSDAKESAQVKIEAKRVELESKYSRFVKELQNEKLNLKNALLSQMPLYKESLKAKLSQL